MQRRHRLLKEARSLVYEISYAKTGQTASYNTVVKSFRKYLKFFGFEDGSTMHTEDIENFVLFLSAVNKQSRAGKQLPLK